MPEEKKQYLVFEEIFRQHYASLSGYAFSILKNKEDAEDIVQDVFVRIWQNTRHIVGNPQVKFYLLTAVKNSCISCLRKKSKEIIQDTGHLPIQEPLHVYSETKRDPSTLIEEALSLLPPQCLIIFKLSRFGNLTYQQIADELNLSVKTVENQIGKALRIVRDYAKKNNISFLMLLSMLTRFSFLVS